MKKFFKNIRKKSPARGGPPPEGSPKLDNRSTSSLVIGYDVREKELGKLHKAAWVGDLSKVQQLAKKDASPLDKENRTPLHLACAQGREDIVQELLEWKAKTNIGDMDSRTPLMKAVECRHDNCVALLLEYKVELDSVDKDGNTCLHIAAGDGSSKIAKMLCQSGANMTIKNREGLAPLHVAVKEKHEEVCRAILNFRGQVDIEDNNLRTPLMYACQDGSINLVKMFLDHGASIQHKDAKGWSADDCAVIQGHHACSQLISDHLLRQQRGSAASTPRSTAGSRSATPRGSSPFLLPPSTPRDGDSVSFGLGLPAADAGGEESGDETISKTSAKGAGSDSWGDDTDVSLAEDRKNKGGAAKVNLAKLVGHMPSESDDGDGQRREGKDDDDSWSGPAIKPKRGSSKSQNSDISVEDSWAAADSPVSPRRSAVRVSFKGDKELSEVHDITATESEGESDHYSTIPDAQPTGVKLGGYIPSASSTDSPPPVSPDKHRGPPHKPAFMEELGLGNADDISELSDGPSEINAVGAAAGAAIMAAAASAVPAASDSEWDSTVKSDHGPRQGILKKWNKVDEGSDWDTTEAEDLAPPVPITPPPPVVTKVDEWDSEVEEVVVPQPATTTATIPLEVEVMLRRKQAEAQDTDEDDSSSQHNEVKGAVTSDLLSVTIEQSAKEYLGNESLDVTPQADMLDMDKPSQDSEWDSPTDAVTPRNAAAVTSLQPVQAQESDWDSTTEAVTPRPSETQQKTTDTVRPISDDDDDDDDDEVEAMLKPQSQPAVVSAASDSKQPADSTAVTAVTAVQPPTPTEEEEEDEESAWDSDDAMLPSDAAPALPQDRQVVTPVKGSHTTDSRGVEDDTDDDMEKTETVSEWEVEHKQRKEQARQQQEEQKQAEEEERRRREEEQERQRQEDEERQKREAEERQRQEDLARQKQEEEARERQRQEEELLRQEREREEREAREEEARQRQWEEEEAKRREQLEAAAREAKQEEERQQAYDSDEEFQGQGDMVLPVSSTTVQLAGDSAALNLCQNNSGPGGDGQGSTVHDLMSREELKRVEGQIEAEKRQQEADQALKAEKSRSTPTISTYGSLQPQPSQGVPQASSSSYLSGPTALQIKQRLQIGTTPNMYHSDGMESDDSFASDNERNDIHTSYPALLGSTQSFRPDLQMADDDVLSYTSTEFEGNDPIPTSSMPFSRDVLLNMNLSDPSTLVQVQDYIRETKRHMEQEKNQRSVLENKLRLLAKDKQDLSRKLESVAEAKQSLEQNKLDLEARIRSLEYNLSEEQEKKHNAEMLLTKTKEQLGRKEQQFTTELEGKQRAELTMRNIQLEMRAAQNTIKELEEEREELERQLQHEHNARKLQEQINEEQSRIAQQHQETMATTLAAGMRDKLTEQDSGEGDERSERDKISTELYAIKMEMERQRSRFKDEITLMATENEELQSRIEELKGEIKLNEEAMAHATMQYNVQLGTLRSEVMTSTTSLDKEHAFRDKLETELESLQKRIQVAVSEKDKAVHARNDLERDLHLLKQGHGRDMERKDDEISSLKDNVQHLNQRLHTVQTQMSSMENELHVANTSLLERTNQLQQFRQEAERHKSAQNGFDTNIRMEKELNTKLQVKMEGLQERLSQSQQEVVSLKQEVESLRAASLSSTDPHEQLATVINSLRSDSERTKTMLEERNMGLMEQVQQLKEDLRNADNRYNTVDSDLRRVQATHAEVTHKLSFSEAQLQLLQKNKDQLEQERGQLKAELEKAVERQRATQDKLLEAQARLADMTDRVDRAERNSQLSTQHLAHTSANFTAVTRSKEEMEDTVQRLQVENARLEADLKHERQRTEMLQADLTDSKKVRDSLEALCSNLKSTTAHLEEKLGEETATRVVMAKEARDSKQLLKQELATRSTLGLKIANLEKAKKSAETKVYQAKTEGTDAQEQKAAMETRLSEEFQKNQQLQKEVANLKVHLKAAKKKMKEPVVNGNTQDGGPHYADFKSRVSVEGGRVSTPRGGGDPNNSHHHYHHVLQSQVENGHVDIAALQQELEMKYRKDLNRKLEEINTYLENQALARDRLDTSRYENESRLASDKRRLEEESNNLKRQYEQALAQRESSDMEARRFKQLYESEMQWRIRLSDQLQFAADKSLHLKSPLLGSDHKSRLHGSVGNLNRSAMSEAALGVSGLGADPHRSLSNKIRAELDRSIAKHLEAAPHSDIVPVIRETEDALLNKSLTRSSKDYIDILKRKYHVP